MVFLKFFYKNVGVITPQNLHSKTKANWQCLTTNPTMTDSISNNKANRMQPHPFYFLGPKNLSPLKCIM